MSLSKINTHTTTQTLSTCTHTTATQDTSRTQHTRTRRSRPATSAPPPLPSRAALLCHGREDVSQHRRLASIRGRRHAKPAPASSRPHPVPVRLPLLYLPCRARRQSSAPRPPLPSPFCIEHSSASSTPATGRAQPRPPLPSPFAAAEHRAVDLGSVPPPMHRAHTSRDRKSVV